MALDRDTVVATALRLIDEGGLESLTLRKLASELGVQAPALYWHVKNKRELLDLVAMRLADEQRENAVHPRPGQDWDDWLAQRLLDARRAMLGHRDSALVAAGNRPTSESLPGVEELLGSMTRIGLAADDALMFILASGNYLVGGVLEHQASASRGLNDEDRGVFDEMLDAERYPHLAEAARSLAAAVDGLDPVTGRTDPGGPGTGDVAPGGLDDRVFRFGLDLMIDGLRARLTRSADGADEPR